MMKLMRRLSPRGPRADGGRYERQVDSSEDLNTMLSQSTAESLKERIEASLIPDMFFSLDMGAPEVVGSDWKMKGISLLRYDHAFRSFAFQLFDDVLMFKASVTGVQAFAKLQNYDRVIRGDCSKGVFVALCGCPGDELVLMFPLDSPSDRDSTSFRLYNQLVQYFIQHM